MWKDIMRNGTKKNNNREICWRPQTRKEDYVCLVTHMQCKEDCMYGTAQDSWWKEKSWSTTHHGLSGKILKHPPVPALESWRPPPGASERPLPRGPREAPKQAPPPPPLPGTHSRNWRAPSIELWGPTFNIQENLTVHFHTQCALCTRILGAYVKVQYAGMRNSNVK